MLFESAVSVMLEGAMIARAEGVRLADDDILIEQLRTVLEATRGNRCSCCKTFAQDVKLKSTLSMEKFAVVVKWLAFKRP